MSSKTAESTFQIPILRTIQKVPGGMMSVFFILGALVNTIFPNALTIGSFTTGLFKDGGIPLIGLVLFCSGAQISFKSSGIAMYKGSLLAASKILIGMGISYLFAVLIGDNEAFAGIHPITVMIVLICTNGGLFMALAERYGDETDLGGGTIIMLTASPFFVFIGISMGGMAEISFIDIVAVIVPALAGMLLGNADEDFRSFLRPGVRLAIPFFAFALGANISLTAIIHAGLQGVLLAVLTVLFTGALLFPVYAVFVPRSWKEKGNSIAAGMGNTAGNTVIYPVLIASIDPSFAPFVETATAQIGASAILTAVFCPYLVHAVYDAEQKMIKRKIDDQPKT